MAYIAEYWNNKAERAEQARRHTQEMSEKYPAEISCSVKNTVLYSTGFVCIKPSEKLYSTVISVVDMDTVQAAYMKKNGKTALLNFSSYKNPGGMFMNGSKAQEECLCHSSFLYNVLTQKHHFYEWNNTHKNKALYMNRALYSPDIIFTYDNNEFSCDVITCAAPNKSAAQKYQNVSDKTNTDVLRSRIKFVLEVAYENNAETLILGAYGCGVFGQDPYEVAGIFREYLLNEFQGCYKNVIFAIPKGNINCTAFAETFAKET